MTKAKLVDLTIKEATGERVEYLIPEGKTEVTIGRKSNNDIPVPDRNYIGQQKVAEFYKKISRCHCTIICESNLYKIVDGVKGKKSTNGTYVGEKKITSENGEILDDEDVISLGENNYKLKFTITEALGGEDTVNLEFIDDLK